MNTKLAFCVLAGLLAFVMTAQTTAAVAVYGTQSDYDDATGAQIFLIGFNGSPEDGALVDGDSFSAQITFGSPEATEPTKVWWNSDAITDAGSTTAPTDVGPMDGVFATPVFAFALIFLSAGEAEEVSLYDASDTLIDTVTAPNPSGFFGVVSDVPIKKFVIDNGEFPSGDPDRFFIDNFRANKGLLEIDIKPGSFPSSINLKKKGLVPVAIHTTDGFDATTVDPTTVLFNSLVAPVKWEIYDCDEIPNPAYVDPDTTPGEPEMIGDGDDDLVLYFDAQELKDSGALSPGDTEATLTGQTFDGAPFEGTGDVNVVVQGKP